MTAMPRTTTLAGLAALALFTSLASGCIVDPTPPVVVSAPPPPPDVVPAPPPPVDAPVVEAPIVASGDVALFYDFGGWSCWDLDVASLDVELYDSTGQLIAEAWDVPCDPLSPIEFYGLPWDTYEIDVFARDPAGWDVLSYQDWFSLYGSYTEVYVTLY